jgi:putative heme iron utilization protein
MDAEDRELLRSLLVDGRLLALGLVVEGQPVVGLLPFAVAEGFSAVYVQASSLARHSQGLTAGARFSAVIHRPDTPDAEPLQTPRVILEGVVDPLEGERPELEVARQTYLRRFPSAAMTLALPDFSVYRLELRGGRLVAGFGRALNLSASHFGDLGK